jgi:hypothetical protein
MELKDIWKNKKEILEGVSNSLKKDKTILEVSKLRQDISNSCESLSTDCLPMVSTCCKICGCSIKFKTNSMSSSCPINKWPRLKD